MAPTKRMAWECEAALVGRGISRFHKSLHVADIRELAQRTSRHRFRARHRVVVHRVGAHIDVATVKHPAIFPCKTAGANGRGPSRRHAGRRSRRCPASCS